MKMQILSPMLLAAAVLVSPASANWFSNPNVGINLNLGSAPSPTPDDIRAGRQPMLVRDADGNVIAMIDAVTGKVIATAEPPAEVAAQQTSATVSKVAAPAPARLPK